MLYSDIISIKAWAELSENKGRKQYTPPTFIHQLLKLMVLLIVKRLFRQLSLYLYWVMLILKQNSEKNHHYHRICSEYKPSIVNALIKYYASYICLFFYIHTYWMINLFYKKRYKIINTINEAVNAISFFNLLLLNNIQNKQ